MNKLQNAHFDNLYQQHVNALKRQGKSKVTIDSYARAVRRISTFFGCPDSASRSTVTRWLEGLLHQPD